MHLPFFLPGSLSESSSSPPLSQWLCPTLLHFYSSSSAPQGSSFRPDFPHSLCLLALLPLSCLFKPFPPSVDVPCVSLSLSVPSVSSIPHPELRPSGLLLFLSSPNPRALGAGAPAFLQCSTEVLCATFKDIYWHHVTASLSSSASFSLFHGSKSSCGNVWVLVYCGKAKMTALFR